MARPRVDNRKVAIYHNWRKTQNMAETGRIFDITRERVRQVVNEFRNETDPSI